MRESKGLILNWYGPGKIETTLADGRNVALRVTTDYPRDGRVTIEVNPSMAGRYSLKLRIPYWSAKTDVKVNDVAMNDVESGAYLALDREWKAGDRIELNLDFTLHYWAGEKESVDKVSIYRGPLLLAYDRRFNPMDPADVPRSTGQSTVGRDYIVAGPSHAAVASGIAYRRWRCASTM